MNDGLTPMLKGRRALRLYFTLLEMLVVLTILSFGAILTGIKLKDAYDEQRFLSNVTQVTSLMRTAQELMLLMDGDVHFKMKWNEDQRQYEAWIEAERSLQHLPFTKKSTSSEEKINFRKQFLSHIISYQFQSTSGEKQTSEDRKELDILFSFGKMSEGVLTLSPLKERSSEKDHFNQDYQIDLVNYPRPIESQKKRKSESEPEDLLKVSQRVYPENVDKEGL